MQASIPVFRMVAFTAMIVVDYLLYIHGLANLVEAVRRDINTTACELIRYNVLVYGRR